MKFKISHSLYKLKAPRAVQTGLLLKLENSDNGDRGYCAVQPHPHLGDPTVDQILVELNAGRLSQLTRAGLDFARFGWIRAKNQFQTKPFLFRCENNFLIQHMEDLVPFSLLEAKQLKFHTVKFKITTFDADKITQALEVAKGHGLKVRLDPNGKLNPNQAISYFRALPGDLRDVIDYLEDPFPYSEAHWRELNTYVPLANDFFWQEAMLGLDNLPFQNLILKPVRHTQSTWQTLAKFPKPISLTSSMDHPIGILQALSFLALNKQSHWSLIHGLNTFTSFEPISYDHMFDYSSPVLELRPNAFLLALKLLEEETWRYACELTL